LPGILYGCDTWSVTLRGEYSLRVSDSGALRKALGPERESVAGYKTKLHYEEFHDVHSSPNIIRRFKSRRMRWQGRVARMGKRRGGET
jgi:hypothetical protein